jgi:hypothetical protein
MNCEVIKMIRHIVMWKFKPDEEENMRKFLDGLNSLNGKLPMIKHMETGINTNPDNDYDAVLLSDFDSMEDLNSYKNHPDHIAVSRLCKSIREARVCVDYEI